MFLFFSLSAVCNKERNITAKVAEHNSTKFITIPSSTPYTKYDPLYQVRPLMPKDGSDLEDSKIIMPVHIYTKLNWIPVSARLQGKKCKIRSMAQG